MTCCAPFRTLYMHKSKESYTFNFQRNSQSTQISKQESGWLEPYYWEQKNWFDLLMLTQMLGETKQVCYNSQRHSVHLFFWTRETSTGWAKVFEYIPFRNRRFVLRDGRPADNQPGETPSQRSVRIWKRQIGSDGIRNEERHNRYRVKLLNVSRFIDEAALDAFIRAKFKGSFATFQEPKYGRQTFQTGAWEIYFKSPGCPGFLENVKIQPSTPVLQLWNIRTHGGSVPI
ncbi:Hypothetical protein PHPALM_5077 [Phytophthora palmivora]|uniref:Uncharacterized protein n=1 Tax=Phytophthora palmivora TaxID=4796 RepID=A0A2P4YI88_9STRA|nr:Hypothetical protein PHPALM_5077 [Phytophthora palmivora]